MEGQVSAVEGLYIRLHHIARARDDDSDSSQNDVTASLTVPDRILKGEGNSSVVTVLNAGPGASSYALQDLYYFRKYTVFLVPFHKSHEGKPSNSRTFVTPEAGKNQFKSI